MAIKNPNPNIKDFEVNDNTTWSSNHIAAGLQAAGVDVGSGGSVEPVTATLLVSMTTEEALSTISISDLNVKKCVIILSLTYDTTQNVTIYAQVKTDSSPNSFKKTPAYNTRSFTLNTNYLVFLNLDCTGGLMTGNGYSGSNGSYGGVQSGANNVDPCDSIIKDVEVKLSAAAPAGTNIKIYGY